MISSYGSIYALGHKAVAEIYSGVSVEATEKVDGSQISFGVIDGELLVRSKGQELLIGANNHMFNLAIEQIQARASGFVANYVYRGEYLMKPKHNTLCYDRVPLGNIMIYDIERSPGSEDYLRWRDRHEEAVRIGFEPVPTLYVGEGLDFEKVQGLLTMDSILGGVKIEGVVVKNYNLFTEDKRAAKAKFVSPAFKEKHIKEWKTTNPSRQDVVEHIIHELKTENRWRKAVQHMRDDGNLDGSPKDIGPLMKEAQADILKEEEDYIKQKLFDHFKGQIMRGVVSGLPEWYKEQLALGEI